MIASESSLFSSFLFLLLVKCHKIIPIHETIMKFKIFASVDNCSQKQFSPFTSLLVTDLFQAGKQGNFRLIPSEQADIIQFLPKKVRPSIVLYIILYYTSKREREMLHTITQHEEVYFGHCLEQQKKHQWMNVIISVTIKASSS